MTAMKVESSKAREIVDLGASGNSEDKDLMSLAYMLVVFKISTLESSYEHETDVLADRHKRIEFLNKVHRLFNSSDLVDDRGAMELKGEAFEELKAQATEMLAEMEARKQEAEELTELLQHLRSSGEGTKVEMQRLESRVEFLTQSAAEMQDTLSASHLLTEGKTKFSRDERDRMIDNVRTQDKLMKTQNSYQSQMIQKLQTERLEFINIGKEIMSKLDSAMKSIARNMR